MAPHSTIFADGKYNLLPIAIEISLRLLPSTDSHWRGVEVTMRRSTPIDIMYDVLTRKRRLRLRVCATFINQKCYVLLAEVQSMSNLTKLNE